MLFKLQKKDILPLIMLTLCMFVCGNLFDGAFAFGVFCGGASVVSPFAVAIGYIASQVFYGWNNLFVTAVRVAVVVVAYVVHFLVKRRSNAFLRVLYYIVANVFYVLYNTESYFNLFDKLSLVALAVCFALVCENVCNALCRGLSCKMALDEMVCLWVVVVAVCYGLCSVTFFGYNLLMFAMPFAVLFVCCSFPSGTAVTVASLCGIGALAYSGDIHFLAFAVIGGTFCELFNKVNRYTSAVSLVVCNILCSVFIEGKDIVDVSAFLPTIFACVCFCLLPNKLINYVRDTGIANAEKYASQSILSSMRMNLARKLYRLSDVFLSMKNTYFSMVAPMQNGKDASQMVVNQAKENICAVCSHYSDCWRRNTLQTEQNINSLVSCALKKGKVNILDASESLSANCSKLTFLLSEINTLAERYINYHASNKSFNQSKLLIGEEMGGVSKLLANLASDVKGKVVFDNATETEITEQLLFHNILCAGTVIVEDGSGINVIVTVAEHNSTDSSITRVVSNIIKQSFEVERTEKTDGEGWVNVFLRRKPQFCVSFGIASVAKSGNSVSGDTHSFVRTDNGKCIFAICDGMGSGVEAEKMSNTAITLVENFYRAGFDSELILSSVNKLLARSGNEVFCAVDICGLDLNNGMIDFIKLGSPASFVRSGSHLEIIKGSSLPLGVLTESKPTTAKKVLNSGDDVIIMSDGVVDTFCDIKILTSAIAEASFTTPQSVADYLCNKALSLCNGKNNDDLTIVVAHLV